MKRKRVSSYHERVIKKALGFERALHHWDRWLDSIIKGREALAVKDTNPSLQEMRNAASEALVDLGFPPCTFFELYWLCCVFCDYWTDNGFMFERLIPPNWFPFPFGFGGGIALDFKGKRIYPPEVWNQSDLEFREEWGPFRPRNTDFTMVLASSHPVRKLVQRGRPEKTTANGETLLPHKVTSEVTTTGESKKVKATKCSWCGGSMLWDAENQIYKCMACGRW